MLHRTMLSMALAGALALGPSALAAGPPRDGDAIAKMLQSDSPQDVATALRVLAGTPTVGLEAAERLLEDPDPLVRRAVARTLKWFPPSPELQGVIERAVAQSRAKRAARLATAPR